MFKLFVHLELIFLSSCRLVNQKLIIFAKFFFKFRDRNISKTYFKFIFKKKVTQICKNMFKLSVHFNLRHVTVLACAW